jgi:predicted nucleotidyltransferase component of viral defense system
MTIHWEILDDHRQALLKRLALMTYPKGVYLAGGTGLSLQMKLRTSVDFDFFVPTSFNEEVLYQEIKEAGFTSLDVIQKEAGTLDLRIEGVQVSYFFYPYPQVAPLITDIHFKALSFASPRDIALMKFQAIGSRGSKKDFYDLYEILKEEKIPGKDLLQEAKKKFGTHTELSYFIMGLTYFEDAEDDLLPQLFVPADWQTIKDFFIEYAKEVKKNYLSLSKKK